MTTIRHEDVGTLRKKLRNKKIVYCSGSFDLFHAGHILFLEECKKLGDVLVVEVGSDSMLRKVKGKNRPILNEHIRLKIIDSLRPVDYCYIGEHEDETVKFSSLIRTFKNLKPTLYVVNEDAYELKTRKKLFSKYDTKIVVLKRTAPKRFDNISSTQIINKILGK